MGWTKTMSDNGVKTNEPGRKQDEQKQVKQEEVGHAILCYTEELRREMNFRLLTEHEDDKADPWNKYLAPERVLYVDSITVEKIRYPDK